MRKTLNVIAAANRSDEVAALAQALDALPDGEHVLTKEIVRGLVAKLPGE